MRESEPTFVPSRTGVQKNVQKDSGDRMPDLGDPIVWHAPAITEHQLEAFQHATGSTVVGTFGLTFATVFRAPEFLWLDRLKIDMRQLLHTDQTYEYFEPLKVGDTLTISTQVTEYKERRELLFVTVESDMSCEGVLKVRARSAFVVRLSMEVPGSSGTTYQGDR